MTGSTSPGARWVPLAAAALIVLTAAQNGSGSVVVVAVCVVLLVLAGATALLATRALPPAAPQPVVLGLVTGALTLPTSFSLAARFAPDSPVWAAVFAVVLPTVTGSAVAVPVSPTRRRPWLTIGAVVIVSGLAAASLQWVGRRIDVHVFLTDGVDALLHGANPYTTVFPNIYSALESVAYYGAGAVVGDHLAYGFPYLPGTLLTAVPGYLLGDVRLSGVLLLGVLAVLVVLATPDLRGRFVAITLVTAPAVTAAVTGAWTEPAQVAVVGFALVALRRRRLLVAAILLGLALATKQYLVVALPALWLLRGVFGRREWVALFGTACVVTVPFALADPGEFWRSVVEWQLIQPFRPDSVSLLALSVDQLGWPPTPVYSLLPVAVGLGVAVLLAWRLRPGPSAFLLATGLSLLATVLLSKQAFVNYYLFVGGVLLLAAWTAGDGDPLFRTRPRSLLREVPEVGDVRRQAGVHA